MVVCTMPKKTCLSRRSNEVKQDIYVLLLVLYHSRKDPHLSLLQKVSTSKLSAANVGAWLIYARVSHRLNLRAIIYPVLGMEELGPGARSHRESHLRRPVVLLDG